MQHDAYTSCEQGFVIWVEYWRPVNAVFMLLVS